MHLLSVLFFVSCLPSVFPIPAAVPAPVSHLLVKRYDKDDAKKSNKVKQWMGDQDISSKNYVFWAGSSGKSWTSAFVEKNTEYTYFPQIFDDEFSKAFGGADPDSDNAVAKACSKAMAEYASGDTRVFNNKNGTLSP